MSGSIMDQPMKCNACGWLGTVGGTMPCRVSDSGLGCPICWKEVNDNELYSNHIYFKKGFKYILCRKYIHQTSILGYRGGDRWVYIFKNGKIRLADHYPSDGPSGPTWDTLTAMRAAFVHDGLAQLTRMGVLPVSTRKAQDGEFRAICLEDQMFPLRAWAWHRGLRVFGADSVKPESARPVIIAPRIR